MTAPRLDDPFLAEAQRQAEEGDDPFLAEAERQTLAGMPDLPPPVRIASDATRVASSRERAVNEARGAAARREILPQLGRGLAESGLATVQASGSLLETLADLRPSRVGARLAGREVPSAEGTLTDPIRRYRDEEVRPFYGDPDTGAGVASQITGRLLGDAATIAAGGRAVRAVAPGLTGGANASGYRRLFGGIAENVAGAAPVTVGQALDPETSATSFLAEHTDSRFLDRLASSTGGRLVGDLAADALLSLPFEALPAVRQARALSDRDAGIRAGIGTESERLGGEWRAGRAAAAETAGRQAKHTELGEALDDLLRAKEAGNRQAVEGLPLVRPDVPEVTVDPLRPELRGLPLVGESPEALRGLPVVEGSTRPLFADAEAPTPRPYRPLFEPKPPKRDPVEWASDLSLSVDDLPRTADFGIDTRNLDPELVAQLDSPEYRQARRESLNRPSTAKIQTPEREAMRAQKVAELYHKRGVAKAEAAPIPERPVGKRPTVHIIMGVPASGKSKVFADKILRDNPWAWLADSDEFKNVIDEYEGGRHAAAVHVESDRMMLDLVDRLMAEGRDIVLPKVGKSEDGLRTLMEEFQRNGYDVELDLNDLPAEKAARRLYDRWKNENRFVDATYLLGEVGNKPTQVFQRLKGHPAVTKFAHYSNDVDFGRPPVMVEEGANPSHHLSQEGGTRGPADTRPAAGDGSPAAEGGPRRDAGSHDQGMGAGPAGEGRETRPPEIDPTLGRSRLTGADGARDTVTLPDGQKVPVTYRVVDAAGLRPSHDPISFAESSDYPAGVQGRRYHSDRAAQENVVGGVGKLDPDRLLRDTGSASGTPIITPDGVVVGGNQRTMMLRRALETNPERFAEYRALLEERAQRFGLDPEQIRGMREPVLVRELDPSGTNVTDAAALRRFNDLTDTVSKKARSGVDEGMARASRMAGANTALDTFAETVGPEESLRGYLDGQHGRKFIEALINDGVLTRAEAGRFFDAKGQVTAEAKDLLERTFYAAAIGDANVLERVPKSILNKLDSSLPALVRAGRDETYTLRPVLAEALDELAQVAARKAEGSGISSLADLRAQGDIFADAAANPQARALADLLEGSSKGDVTKALRTYGRRVDEAVRAKGSNDLFDYTPPKQEEVFQQALGKKGESFAGMYAGTLFSNPITPVLQAISKNRELSGATFAGLGAMMQDSDDPTVEATGRFMIGLGALHAIGIPRIARAGGKAGQALVDILRKNPVGRKAVEFVHPDALLAPGAKQAIRDYEDLVAKGRARAKEFGKKAADLGPEGDRAVSDVIEGEDWGAQPADLEATLAVAQGIADEFDALGRMKVESGVLPEVAVAANQGKYAGPRLYAEYEALDALGEKAGTGAPRKTRIAQQKKRTLGSDPESLRIRNEKGEIREASYRAERGIEKGYRDVAAAKLFQSLRAMPGVVHPEFAEALDEFLAARNLYAEARAAGAPAEELKAAEDLMRGAKEDVDAISGQFRAGSGDYVAMPDTPGMGVLRGMVVTREVANSLNGLPDMKGTGPFIRFWKQKNTVWNPGTHIGNAASNVTMAHMAGLPMWRQPQRIVQAVRDMASYGPATRALAEGGVLDLNAVTAGSEGAAAGRRATREELLKLLETSRPKTVQKLRELGLEKTTWDQVKAAASQVHGPLARLYNNEDNWFRIAYYLHATTPAAKGGLGLSAEEALKRTRSDLIDFRSRSPALRLLRGTVAPFVLYPAKALPTFAKHMIEHPWRYAGLMAGWGILDQLAQEEVGRVNEADLPPAQRRGGAGYGLPGFTQLPFTGPQGEKAGYDVSRWTPLSALTTNAPPGAASSLLSDRFPSILNPSGPATDLASIALNVDPYTGDKRFSPAMTGDELAAALAEAAGDQVLPPVLAFQRRRLVDDIRNRDPGATKVDAAGLLGLRPRYVRPGEYEQRAGYELEQAALKAKQDLRRGLRRSNNPARDDELYQQYEDRMEALRQRYDQRVNP